MKRLVDHLAVVFDFEKEIFQKAEVPVSFVGHPLLDQPDAGMSNDEFRKQLAIPDGRPLVGLLPGSRRQEVERLLPVMLGAAKQLLKNDPRLHFGLGEATRADRIEVVWPSGTKTVLTDVAGDRVIEIREE